MDRTAMGAARSRARVEINTHGGRVTGMHKDLPIVYAIPPLSGPVWPCLKVYQKVKGVRSVQSISHLNGCTVIWS
ncbi:hypothetical protein EHW65_07895 [Erwinia psidii]|uniref:hypothetical protein n=1 Tax=Erwinia psidii TaxID=69224 RepID=UPI00226B4851|nr:hypothetical protein [Erwinia psidii]MCX8957193.1 hypothetical protein [Erwinia psidii]